MGSRGSELRLVLAAAVSMHAVCAQRAPCTGVVHDANGAPLPAARLTFAQEVSQRFGRDLDRVETISDGQGRFSADLVLGSPYVVWAASKPEADGTQWSSAVTMDGVAGRTLELHADRRRAPSRIALTSVSPWSKQVTVFLRVLIGGRYQVGPDLPIPGDIKVPLPPLPDGEANFALVDDKGQVLCWSDVVAEDTQTVAFPVPRLTTCETVDANGDALADVGIRVEGCAAPGAPNAFDDFPGMFVAAPGIVAHSDHDGRRTLLLPANTDTLVVASLRGHGERIAGFIDGRLFVGDHMGDASSPLRFEMGRQAPRTWGISGLGTGLSCRTAFAVSYSFRTLTAWGVGEILEPVDFVQGAATTEVFGGNSVVYGHARMESRSDAPPPRVVSRPGLAPLDLTTLRSHVIQVVDSRGQPVPFAQIAIAMPGQHFPKRWCDRGVTDADGKLQVLHDDAAWIIVATDGVAVGKLVLQPAEPTTETVLHLLPPRAALLRIRGPDGAPVGDARIRNDESRGGPSILVHDESAWALDLTIDALQLTARSDGSGLMRIPMRGDDTCSARIGIGALGSEVVTIKAGDEEIAVTLHR